MLFCLYLSINVLWYNFVVYVFFFRIAIHFKICVNRHVVNCLPAIDVISHHLLITFANPFDADQACKMSVLISWVKVFMIIPEFRILRLTFLRKSASKCWIRQKFNCFSDLFSVHLWAIDLKMLRICTHTSCFKIGILKVQDFWILNFHPCDLYLSCLILTVFPK